MQAPMEIAAKGRWGRVVWAKNARGRLPARDFYMALSDAEKAKVQATFGALADFGRIPNTERFKKLRDDLFEFKNHQIRMVGAFRPGQVFLVAHGVRKRKDKHRPEDLEIAIRVLTEHDAAGGTS